VGRPPPVTEFQTASEVGERLDVSRETLERLKRYVELLLKWQRAINLIGPNTAQNIWCRHILDSGQLMAHLPTTSGPVVDIGSGAGLPGMVLAIMGVPDVHLIDSDSRKCAFLHEASRVTGTAVQIHNSRVETAEIAPAAIVTARAVAPLKRLIELTQSVSKQNTVFFFFKGKDVKNELTEIKKNWNMSLDVIPSYSSTEGVILRMESLTRVDAADD
tara:strand:+ start:77 stop:727 length:651 start_codon:yes stop_codon:yes gene_type:complete